MANRDFVVKNGLVTGSNNITIGSAAIFAANGNVGIGNLSPGNKLVVNGGVTSGDISAGNITCGTITASGAMSVPSVSLTGSLSATSLSIASNAFVANSIGAYHTGTVNATSFTVGTFFVANSAGMYSPAVNTTLVTSSIYRTGSAFEANTTGVYHTGLVNASSFTVSSFTIANSTGLWTPSITSNSIISGSYGGTGGAAVNTTVVAIGSSSANVLANSSGIYINGGLAINASGANNASNLGGVAAGNYARLASPTFTGTLTAADVTINGNLIVNGTTTTINATALDIRDLNITLAKGTSTAAAASGAGITIEGAGVYWNYNNPTNTWLTNIGISSTANNFGLGSSTNLWNIFANNVSAVAFSGNGASITSVNAVTLGGFNSSYFVANATFTSYQTTLSNSLATYAPLANPTFTGSVSLPGGGVFVRKQDNAAEGGEITLEKSTNSTLSGNIIIDNNNNLIRIFEAGGTYRGAVLDIGGCGSQSTLIHSGIIGSYAPTLTGGGASGTWGISITGRGYPRRSDGGDINFFWSGQPGQPTWLWGGTDGTNMYVYNPSNFTVANFNNSSIYTNANQINAQGTATDGAEIALNYVGFNVANSYFRNTTVYNGKNGLIGKFNASDTTLYCYGNIVAFTSSDETLKENIKPIPNALEKVQKINGVEFDWTDEYLAKQMEDETFTKRKHDIGVIAQQVEAILPEIVMTRQDGTKAVKYERLVPLLIEAIKDLSNQVNELNAKIGE